MDIEPDYLFCHYNNENIICPSCQSKLSIISDKCCCDKTTYIRKFATLYHRIKPYYIFSFNMLGDSTYFNINYSEYIIKNYCFINKSEKELLLQIKLINIL